MQELNILGKIAVRHFQSFLFSMLGSRHMDRKSCPWPIWLGTPHRKPKWVQWRQPTWVHRDARGNVVYGSHSGNLDWAHEAAHVGPMMGQLRLSSWVRCDSLLTFANICISTTIIKELASAIHSPVAMVGLAPPNTTPRPPKLKQNTLNQWSLCQILECQATLHKRKAHWRPPGDDSGRLLAKTAISCVLVVFKAES